MKTFGIIGGGNIAHFHAQAIQAMETGKLGAAYVRNPEQAVAFEKRHGCRVYTELADLLADPEIDIVTITTPSGAHLDPAVAAARAGKHIICEKPLEVTPGRVSEMIQVCETEGVLLSGIFNRRFTPAVEALRKAVQSGRFGVLTFCDAYVKWYRTQAYYDSAAWRGTWALDGGGALMNQSIHTIDLLIYIAGNIKRLSATTACLSHEGIEVEDTAVAILEFESGARGVIQGSTACWSSSGHPAEVQICGSKGSAFLKDDRFSVWDFQESDPEDEWIQANLVGASASGAGANDPNAMDFLGHQRNFEDVVAALESGKTPLITGAEAMKSVQVIDAIYRSAGEEGKWVSL